MRIVTVTFACYANLDKLYLRSLSSTTSIRCNTFRDTSSSLLISPSRARDGHCHGLKYSASLRTELAAAVDTDMPVTHNDVMDYEMTQDSPKVRRVAPHRPRRQLLHPDQHASQYTRPKHGEKRGKLRTASKNERQTPMWKGLKPERLSYFLFAEEEQAQKLIARKVRLRPPLMRNMLTMETDKTEIRRRCR